MANLERKHQLIIRVTEEEYEIIQQKMMQCGTRNFSHYARKMLLEGFVLRCNFDELKSLTHELSNLARSINQIAYRVNETRSIYAQDVKDLQKMYYEVKQLCQNRLIKMVDMLGTKL